MNFYYKQCMDLSRSETKASNVSSCITKNETLNIQSVYSLVNSTSVCTEEQNLGTLDFLYFPYFLCALLFFFAAFCFLVITLIPTPEEIKYLLQNMRKNTRSCIPLCKGGCEIDKISIIFLMCSIFSYIINGASFSSFVVYIFTVAFEAKIGFTRESASFLTLITLTVIAVSRTFTSVITHFVSVKIVVLLLTLSTFISDISLVLFGMGSGVNFWICVTLKSALIGSVASNLLPFYDKYVTFTGKLISLFSLTYTFGQGSQYLLNGYLIEHLGAWYNLLLGLIFSFILVIIIYFLFIVERLKCFSKATTSAEEEEKLLEDD